VRNQRGLALTEALLLGLVLLVPLLWLLGILSDLQRGALASSAAAKEAGVEAARWGDATVMEEVVNRTVSQVFRDHGLDPRDAEVVLRGGGAGRGSAVEVIVGYDVTVLQAPFLGRVSGPSIEVTASHVARVDPYASRP
jgi:hypothetical protein